MAECGDDMGGIWLPNPRGGQEYKVLHCNKPEGHNWRECSLEVGKQEDELDDDCPECRGMGFYYDDDHAYLDIRSGMMIQKVISPRIVVDRRGSVLDAPR